MQLGVQRVIRDTVVQSYPPRAYDKSPLRSYALEGIRLFKGTERGEKSDLTKIVRIWHYDVSLWSTSSVTHTSNWSSTGAASAASFPILSSVKLAISPSILS